MKVWEPNHSSQPATSSDLRPGSDQRPSGCSSWLDLQTLQRVTEVQLLVRHRQAGRSLRTRGGVDYAGERGARRGREDAGGKSAIDRTERSEVSADERSQREETSGSAPEAAVTGSAGEEEQKQTGEEREERRGPEVWRAVQLALRLRMGSQEGGGTEHHELSRLIDIHPRYTVFNGFDVPILVCQDGLQVMVCCHQQACSKHARYCQAVLIVLLALCLSLCS